MRPVLILTGCVALSACASIVGADFDVRPRGAEPSGGAGGEAGMAGGSGGSDPSGGSGGTAGGAGATAGGGGGGPTCDPDACPGNDTDCRMRGCVDDECGFVNAQAGTPCSDAGGVQCDGFGDCVVCLSPPTPPGAMTCPAACDSCNATTCFFDCTGADKCRGQTLTCPAGFDCQIDCDGNSACENTLMNCPATYACGLTCTQQDGCKSAQVNCTDGPCQAQCSNHASSCFGTTLHCGAGECTASCAGTSMPTVNCNTSCTCTSC